ncbi:MAG: response regulator [Parvibaculum sp.]
MFAERTFRRRTFEIAALWWLGGTGEDAAAWDGNEGSANAGLPLAGHTVLVVEDEFFVGLEIAQTLETAGAKIVGPARTLSEALEYAADDAIDMAVLDVDLDGEYSFDLARSLRGRGVRVVFATAHADDSSLFHADTAEIPRLGKPTTARALLRALLPLS